MRSLVLLAALLVSCAKSSNTPDASLEAVQPRGGAGDTGVSKASPAPTAPAPTDLFPTSAGELKVTPVHHGTVMFEHAGKVVIVDPWSEGKLGALPKADVVFITDIHPDHDESEGARGGEESRTRWWWPRPSSPRRGRAPW